MPVEIKNMTDAEFEVFSRWSIGHHAEDLVAELRLSPEAALKEARGEFAGILPDDLHTERHRLMTIAEKESGEAVGFIWTIHEEAPGGNSASCATLPSGSRNAAEAAARRRFAWRRSRPRKRAVGRACCLSRTETRRRGRCTKKAAIASCGGRAMGHTWSSRWRERTEARIKTT